MILLSARELCRQFDADPVFAGVSFDVRRGEKVGLVGPNGAGKTTLLNILAGRDEPDVGIVERHPAAGIALLQQDADFRSERTLIEEAREGLAHLYALQHESTSLAKRIAATSGPRDLDKLQRRYDEVQEQLRRLRAYNVDHRVEEVLHGLGFAPEEYDRPLAQFSGGERNRAMLARMLLRAPDVMLLDEPTNHLDIAASEWLEGWLQQCGSAVILVSHDRYFLDRVTERILELFRGRLADYKGNFSAYRRQREERNKVLQRTYEKQQEFIARTEDFIRRNKYGQKHAQAADREKKLARLDRVGPAAGFQPPSMTFGEPTRTGDWVIEATGVSKGFGPASENSIPESIPDAGSIRDADASGTLTPAPLFCDLTLRIERGERIGILGPNGSGKTTLLRVLLGELTPDEGAIRHGTAVKIGYFDQQLRCVDPGLDAVEAVRPPDDPAVTPGELRSLLARFGLTGEMVFQKIGSMSGGERSKVALAKLAAANVNLLVLDEPTNHLDLWSRDSLEEALRRFDGTLVFVSHDRFFLDRVATALLVLEPGGGSEGRGWRHYPGNYSDYVAFIKRRAEEKTPSTAPAVGPGRASSGERDEPQRSTRKRRFPYRKVSDLEAEIEEQEEQLRRLESDLADPDVHRNGQRARELTAVFEETRRKLTRLYEHWEEAVELN